MVYTHTYWNIFEYRLGDFCYILLIIILGIGGNISYTFAVRYVLPSTSFSILG